MDQVSQEYTNCEFPNEMNFQYSQYTENISLSTEVKFEKGKDISDSHAVQQ